MAYMYHSPGSLALVKEEVHTCVCTCMPPATSPPISTITGKRFLQKLITYCNMILQRNLQPYWLQVGWRSDYQFCQFDHTCM